jgi:hypothetical protein
MKRFARPSNSFVGSLLVLFLLFRHGSALAAPVDGGWIYMGANDFYHPEKVFEALTRRDMQILNEKVMLSPTCFFRLTANSKHSREAEYMAPQITDYMKNKYKFGFSKNTKTYKIRQDECAGKSSWLLLEKSTVLFIAPGPVFYYFSRREFLVQNNVVNKYKERVSPLPFLLQNFSRSCEDLIPRRKGVPVPTAICGPLYFPYVAKKGDKSDLAALVGHHRYVSKELNTANDYDDPLSNGLHPVYMILPPLKDVQLVRVDDMDGNAEDRDIFSGAYISIKNGVIVDQLREGCEFDLDYVCSYADRKGAFRLLESGNFEKIRQLR